MLGNTVGAVTADLAASSTVNGRYAAATAGTERIFAEVLAGVVGVDRVSVDSHSSMIWVPIRW